MTASVLQEDAELADAVAAERREAAVREARTRVVAVHAGRWNARDSAAETRGGYGFLVLSGLLVRRVGITDRFGAEVLGPGDLLRPLEHDGEEATLPFEATWRVLDALRLAVLDRRWSFRMAQFPEIGIELTARAIRRSRRLANTLAISHHPRLEDRLLLLLWELADRYGTVRPEGVHVPVPMTHDVLSELAGARRPSVSSALGRLRDAELLVRDEHGWLLRRAQPGGPALAALTVSDESD